MLRSLQVKNYVLIDSLDIEFPAGLVIITGQTGAGKSILLGAISLSLGAKADASMVGDSADNCVVEAVFDMAANPEAEELLEEAGLEKPEDNLLTIRRVLSKSGRSRSFINDEPVQVGILSRLSKYLIDIHSQNETAILSDAKFQLSLLDYYAGNGELLDQSSELFSKLRAEEKELTDLRQRLDNIDREKEFNETAYRKLVEANLSDGEMEELEDELKLLSNAEDIKSGLRHIQDLFSPEEGTPITSALKESQRLLDKVSSYIPNASKLSERMESARLELDDILAEVDDMESRVDVSESRLEAVEERIALIHSLLKRHDCSTEAELIAERDRLAGLVLDSDSLEVRVSDLEKAIAKDTKALDKICQSLHAARLSALDDFALSVHSTLTSLELPDSKFKVELSDAPLSASGKDKVAFLFSATGGALADVAKCASGGERSRIMLSLKAMMAKFTAMPAMIFDEIDTGVSGSAADSMGSVICDMGKDMQVFAITHLPQVAAKGDAHYLVSKENINGRGVTTIHRITGQDRIMEIARMLSGSSITPQAIENAKALLESSAL